MVEAILCAWFSQAKGGSNGARGAMRETVKLGFALLSPNYDVQPRLRCLVNMKRTRKAKLERLLSSVELPAFTLSVSAAYLRHVVDQLLAFEVHAHQVGVGDAEEGAHDLVDDARMSLQHRFEGVGLEGVHGGLAE